MKTVIVNADDYAMDAGVDAAILKLAETGAVTATSVMVCPARWPEAARALGDAPPLSIGLHLDLTSPFVDGEFPAQKLPRLMAAAQARLLHGVAVRREVDRQLSLFEKGMGRAPDFADGHQHIHHFPVIREVLLEALEDRYGKGANRIGLRICAARRWRGVKAAVIGRTGAHRFARLAAERGHKRNSDFAGVYDFAADANLPALWQSWVARLQGELPLIMCHVASGEAGSAEGDPIRQARLREYAWLASEGFRSLCRQHAIQPVRWPQA
jgi:predicted glycoside hydrolase/deacetylase ChbG (UPF0249 family)